MFFKFIRSHVFLVVFMLIIVIYYGYVSRILFDVFLKLAKSEISVFSLNQKTLTPLIVVVSTSVLCMFIYKIIIVYLSSKFTHLFLKNIISVSFNHLNSNSKHTLSFDSYSNRYYSVSWNILPNFFSAASQFAVALGTALGAVKLVPILSMYPFVIGLIILFLFKKKAYQLQKKIDQYFNIFFIEHKKILSNIKQIYLLDSRETHNNYLVSKLDRITSTTIQEKKALLLFSSMYLLASVVLICFPVFIYYTQNTPIAVTILTVSSLFILSKVTKNTLKYSLLFTTCYNQITYVNDYFKKLKTQDYPIKKNNPKTLSAKNITFYYKADKPLLKNLSFTISRGDIIVITGPSGSGKTTLFNVMLGFQKSISGHMLINKSISIPYRDYQKLALITPHSTLWGQTLRYYLSSGKKNEDHILWKHLKIVSLDNRIKQLPNQLDANEFIAINFSMGEIQRLAIAQALISQPHFLFLDEATNNIDVPTEKTIIQNIRNEYPDLALIIINHRFNLNHLKHKKYILQQGQLISIQDSVNLSKKDTFIDKKRVETVPVTEKFSSKIL